MTDLLSDVETPSDAELISRVRGGDVAAYGELFSRHKDAANRLARQLVRGPDSDDLVSEAFAKVLSVLQGGGGPDVAFRAYLLTAVRRLHVDRVRSTQRLQTTDDMTPFDPGVPFQDTAVAGFESGAAAKAFASLPERWQLVLWHLEVEGQKPADIAPLLGMSANSVSALAYRAREGLRQAFLTMHISDLTDSDCRWVNEHLGAFIRKGLSKRDTEKVQAHLDGCRRCTAMYLELTDVNSNLAGIIAPLLLGGAAAGYLASSGAGALGAVGLLAKVKEFVVANSGAVTAAGVAAGVAGVAAIAAITLGGSPADKNVVADPPASLAPSTPGASPATKPTSRATRRAATPVPTAPTSPGTLLGTTPSPAAVLAPTVPATSTTSAPPAAPPAGPPAGTPASVSDVDLGGTTIDDNGVHLVAAGSPSLPPTMTVQLVSAPSGVEFSPSGDCALLSPTVAQCTTVSGGGATVPGAAAMAAPASYTADLPFSDAGPDTADVSITLGLPDGFVLTAGSSSIPTHHYQKPVRHVDAALTFGNAAVRPTDGNHYSVTGTLSVGGPSAAGLPTVTYTVTGGSFGNGAQSVERAASDTTPSFVVVPADPARPDVRVRVGVSAPYTDSDPANDDDAPALSPYDVSLTGLAPTTPQADDQGDQRFTATVHDDGFPGDLTFTATSTDPADTVGDPVRTGDTVTFSVRSASGTRHDVSLAAALPDGFTDANAGNDTGTTGWAPAPLPSDADVDVQLVTQVPSVVRPGPDDAYALPVLVSITGPGTDSLSSLTYTLTGAATFGGDCSGTTCTRTTTGNPSFTIVPDDPTATTPITLTATVPPGFHDTNIDNNTASATLRPYDLSLTDLTPVGAHADAQGDQQFTATLHDDGFAGAVTYTLTSSDGSDQLLSSGRTGDTVTFTVRSGSAAAHPVAVTAHLPAAYRDADTGDNTTGDATWTPAPVTPPTYDVALTGLTPVTGTADADGAQRFTADLARAGFPGTVSFELTDGPAGAVLSSPSDPVSGPVTFTVTSPSTSGHAVGVRAVLSDPGSDPDGTNNVATSTWSPHAYDVSLGVLSRQDATADASGDQVFTAPLGRDGYTGPVGFTLKGPADLSLAGSSVSGSTATFTVHSARTDQGTAPFTITAGPPGGYPDPDPTNNSSSGRYTYYVTPAPVADASVVSSQNLNGQSGKGTVSADVSAPPGVPVQLTVSFDRDKVQVTVPHGCSGSGGTLTCAGTGHYEFGVELVDRTGNETREATIGFQVRVLAPYVDHDAANDKDSELLTRH